MTNQRASNGNSTHGSCTEVAVAS